MSDHVSDIVKYVLTHSNDLSAQKIEALAKLTEAVKGQDKPQDEPNNIPEEESQNGMEGTPIPVEDLLGIQIDNGKPSPIKIVKS